MTNQTKTAADWRQRIDELKAKRDELEQQRQARADERERLALEAQTSKQAADKLAEARRDGAEIVVAIEDTDAAIKAASRELEAAEKREAQAAERRVLKEAEGIVGERIQAAEEIDRLAAELGRAFGVYDDAGDRLRRVLAKSETAPGVGFHKVHSAPALAGALFVAAPKLARAFDVFAERNVRYPLAERERRLFGRPEPDEEAA